MNNILETIPAYQEAFDAVKKRELPLLVSGLSGSAGPVSAVSLFLKGGFKGALLVIVPGQDQVNSWAADLEQLLPEKRVLVFDPAEALPFEVVAASREPAARRLETLASLRACEEQLVVVASIEALLPKLIPPLCWEKAAITLQVDQECDYNELPLLLVQAGYERSETAEAPGQFAVRGDIVDIYPFYGSPVRIEFWGDEIASLKRMDPESQRSGDSLDLVRIWPVREFIYDPEGAKAALERIDQAYKKRRAQLKGNKNALLRLQQKANRLLEMARTGTGGSLNLVQPYFYPEQASLLDYLPEDSLIILDDPGRLPEQIKGRTALLESDYRRLFQEGGSFTPWQEYYFSGEQLLAKIGAFPLVCFTHLLTRVSMIEPKTLVTVTVKEMQPFLGRPDLLAQELKEMLRKKTTILLLTGAESSLKQLERELRDREISFLPADKWQQDLLKGRLQVASGLLRQGFEVPGVLAVITARELYGRGKTKARHRRKSAGRLPDLTPGDYVVHVQQGIGRYLGITKKETDGSIKDYLEIAYAGDARLFVPVDQVDLVQKYVGPEGATPRLSRMGGGDWTRLKQRVKKRVKELAQDLLALYAERERTKGYAFSPDTVWQKEFEEQFPYEETPDQLEAIKQVKADMEKARPMDRLLCGDVGFGKTEVAIRAAFKAVQDGKQVAVLVPTTVLAQQHYLTFKERFARYPVQVDMLSRFRSPAEQRITINNLKKGLVDIVIGTHRLLSKDVVFKDLGLLVVDEEQRFGVAHKEKIKMLKTNVDVLTMTATPIPRTLQMSLGGVRDLSLIETPPEDRLPVQTYVLEYNPEVVREAILKEIQRGGQVFYVHNRVQTIFRTAHYLQGLVPEATFRVAHGQMKEEDLEKVMWEFLNQKFHCLVCTTIIESGLDFPNANTLIVENADWFGLAQLYQLRGRVGRSNRLAYAYFTFNRDKVLTEQAEKRLRALQEFTEFGSGFKLALRDLEIRGAGNILGAEQHGHMAAVGFDLYNQLLQEAVKELKGEKVPEKKAAAPLFDLRVDSYLPDDYIRDGREKVEIYRRLALAESLEEVEELAAEVRDRFGRMPEQVVYLFDLALIRVRAAQLGIKDVQHNRNTMAIRFDDGSALHGEQLAAWSRIFGKRLIFSTVAGLEIRIDTRGLAPKDLVKSLKKVLTGQQQL
ncbi:MAG TPA: transcription-repair coupling factor [Syntrophaceticus sp.]|nr:transcription-repair coupling factor [Syntrophaceticus sp.]